MNAARSEEEARSGSVHAGSPKGALGGTSHLRHLDPEPPKASLLAVVKERNVLVLATGAGSPAFQFAIGQR